MILADFVNQVVLRRPVPRAMPSLDGPWRVNESLDHCRRLAPDFAAPTDLACDTDGRLYVATGTRVLVLEPPDFDRAETLATFAAAVTCLAWHETCGLVAGVTGAGLAKVGRTGEVAALGGDLRHPTGLAIAPNGAVLVAEGSGRHAWHAWVNDLMEKGASGRLLRLDVRTGRTAVLASGLGFPTGVAIGNDGAIHVLEAWRHRVITVTASGIAPQPAIDNLPGYPARLVRAGPEGGWWLSLFAPRSHLVEFVLGEEAFRRRMIATVDPTLWLAPTTDATEHHRRPVQIGGLRSQNIKKPWAPSWSYGLVARLDDGFAPLAALHSRANGVRHGTSGLAVLGSDLLIAATSADCILRATGNDGR